MKIRSGIDILDLGRFEKSYQRRGQKFLETFLAEQEIELAQGKTESLAGFFSAKEAISKAIGSGIWQANVNWHNFLITIDDLGKPSVRLSGEALARYDKMGGIDLDISISHEKEYVVALCVILLKPKE